MNLRHSFLTLLCKVMLLFITILFVPKNVVGQVTAPSVVNNNTESIGIDFVCANCEIQIYPKETDFTPGDEGKVIIKTRVDDNSYPTSEYQQKDGKLIIKAVMPQSCVGQMVYFTITDPDDQSPYENDLDPDDNLDMSINAGSFGGLETVTVEAKEMNFGGQIMAVAETELIITNRYSGDNYQILASLDNTFPEATTTESMEFIAWKRLYVELDLMYRYGATIVKAHNSDSDFQDDWLIVDNVEDFSPGQKITLFRAGNSTTSVTTILEKEDQNGIRRIRIPDLDVYYPKWAGIKINGNGFDATVNYSNELIEQGFGKSPQGSDCGAFVELPIWNYGESGYVPKYNSFENLYTVREYTQVWFSKYTDNHNVIHMLGALDNDFLDRLAYAEDQINTTIYFEENISLVNRKIRIAETINHELGHHFNIVENNHPSSHYHDVDGVKTCSADNPPKVDECVMVWDRNRTDKIAKFDNNGEENENCHYFIRQAELPR